jgi:flagella basal body P-ring formation protein FlgA
MSFLGDDGKGNAHVATYGNQSRDAAEGWVNFAAWVNSKVATRRFRPGELLDSKFFSTQRINVSMGQAHEYRGVLLSPSAAVSQLEAIQTIMEGQFVTSTAVQQVPDVRRGDRVEILLKSGGLVLSTQGVAEESAYIRHKVKVMTGKHKRELQGQLLPNGVVEVKI